MNKIVSLNSQSNGGEEVLATVSFKDRILGLQLNLQCYGSHASEIFIPLGVDDALMFANALQEMAYKARAFYKKNP